jgi:hypothetical protein
VRAIIAFVVDVIREHADQIIGEESIASPGGGR